MIRYKMLKAITILTILILASAFITVCATTVSDIEKWRYGNEVPKLIDALKDKNPEIRQAAARALGILANLQAIQSLIMTLNDTQPHVRKAAVDALMKIHTAKALAGLMTKADSRAVRLNAASALSRLDSAETMYPPGWMKQPRIPLRGVVPWAKLEYGGIVTSLSFSPSPSGRLAVGRVDGNLNIFTIALVDITNSKNKEMAYVFTGFKSWTPKATPNLKRQIRVISDNKVLMTLVGKNTGFLSVAFSPDGKKLAIVRIDGALLLWDVDNDIWWSQSKKGVKRIIWFSDGQRLISLSVYGEIDICDTEQGVLKSFPGKASTMALSPDGRILASGGYAGMIEFWDVASEKKLKTLVSDKDYIYSMVFSPDSRILASASVDGTINLWDVQQAKLLKRFDEHTNVVTCLVFSPDGKTLVSGSADGTIRIWDVDSGNNVYTITEHDGYVLSVAFSPDGKVLASGGGDGIVRLWNTSWLMGP